MRWSLAFCVGAALVGAAGRAYALSCAPPEEVYRPFSPLEASGAVVPIDAQPWRLEPCGSDAPALCVLVQAGPGGELPEDPVEAGAPTIGVKIDDDGAAACDGVEWPEGMQQAFVRRFVPAELLVPGASYGLRCDEQYVVPALVDAFGAVAILGVRAGEEPSAPASALEVADVHLTRSDDGGCCGDEGPKLELRLAGATPKLLAEGGYLEVVYAGGQTLAVVEPAGELFVLPGTREAFAITPVAANGSRGVTVEVGADEIDEDAVYIPCDVTGRRASNGVWLAMAMVWIAGARRRARRSS